MTRKEEIQMQAEKKAFEPSRLMHPYAKQHKVMSAYEIGFIEGAVWADAHPISDDGKAALYFNNIVYENGYKEAVDKACEWIERNYHATPMGGYYYLPEDCIEQFKQAMKGE